MLYFRFIYVCLFAFILSGDIYLPLIQQTQITPMAQETLDKINDYRQIHNCGPLQFNDKLLQAAIDHSDYMHRLGYLEHTDLNTIYHKYHYQWSRLGENIGYNFETPQQIVDGWMTSSSHRSILLNCEYVDIGIGEYGTYWTAIFGKP